MGMFSRLVPGRARPVAQRASQPSAPAPTAPDAAPRTRALLAPGEAFTPTQPTIGRRRMIGREAELRRILQALREDRAHVVLYSERGRGKTSLSNLVVESLRRTGSIVARHTCEADTTFDDLMRGLMRDLPPSLLAARAPNRPADDMDAYDDGDGCEAALPAGELRPRDITTLTQRLAVRDLVCVVDEFDRVEDAATRTRLADTIKQLSDRDVPLLFLIVGVSDNLDEILGQHPSIQRSVQGVHLPLFTDQDVAQLIARGGRETGLAFQPAAIARITVLARGMPYMAQLLALRLAQAATARGDRAVLEQDFDTAVTRLVDDASPRVMRLYAQLTDHGRDAEMVAALRRIATAPQDGWGRMQAAATQDGHVALGNRIVPGGCWHRLEEAGVLATTVAGSGLYSFAERQLLHHVLLLAAREAALPDNPSTGPHRPPDGRSEGRPALREVTPANPASAQADIRPAPARTRLASMSRG